MNLQSMTGFARAVAEHDGTSIAWEVKSVNGKSVEVRLRLPQGFERLEPAVRQTLIDIGAEQGGMTADAASDWFAGLVQGGRYRQDVFN